MRVSVFCFVGLFVVFVFLSLRMKRERDGRVRNTEKQTDRQKERGVLTGLSVVLKGTDFRQEPQSVLESQREARRQTERQTERQKVCECVCGGGGGGVIC